VFPSRRITLEDALGGGQVDAVDDGRHFADDLPRAHSTLPSRAEIERDPVYEALDDNRAFALGEDAGDFGQPQRQVQPPELREQRGLATRSCREAGTGLLLRQQGHVDARCLLAAG
jgi:hypothetical protein